MHHLCIVADPSSNDQAKIACSIAETTERDCSVGRLRAEREHRQKTTEQSVPCARCPVHVRNAPERRSKRPHVSCHRREVTRSVGRSDVMRKMGRVSLVRAMGRRFVPYVGGTEFTYETHLKDGQSAHTSHAIEER